MIHFFLSKFRFQWSYWNILDIPWRPWYDDQIQKILQWKKLLLWEILYSTWQNVTVWPAAPQLCALLARNVNQNVFKGDWWHFVIHHILSSHQTYKCLGLSVGCPNVIFYMYQLNWHVACMFQCVQVYVDIIARVAIHIFYSF